MDIIKSDYTYDFNGKVLAIVKLKADNLPSLSGHQNQKLNGMKFKIAE